MSLPGNPVSGNLNQQSVQIAAAASLSGAADLQSDTLVGVIIPSGWGAASVSFAGSYDNNNFFPLYNVNGEVVLTPLTTGTFLSLDPSTFAGVRYVKVRSGTNGTPINQGFLQTLTLISRTLQR